MRTIQQVEDEKHSDDATPSPPRPAPVQVPPRLTPIRPVGSLFRRINNLESIGTGEFTGNVLASYMALPGLVGFWPMSSVQPSTGNVYDLSAQGRTLTYNGNPVFDAYNGLVPYIEFDGTGDYLSRASETDLNITGNLTIGGWFWFDTIVNLTAIFGKGQFGVATNQYMLYQATDSVNFAIYNSSTFYGAGAITISTGQWYFLVGRFVPSTSITLFVNKTTSVNTTSIPASLQTTANDLRLGSMPLASDEVDGRASLCFVCAAALSDSLISALYEQSRVLFGI